MSETIVVPDNGNTMNNALPYWLLGNNGWNNGFGGGLGTGILGFLLGAMFNGGWGGNGFGWGNNGNNGAAALGAQATAYNNTDLLMQAITAQGEQSRQAISTLHRAAHNLRGGLTDTGLTYTNARERCTIIALSEASSRAEFANTWFHEVLHAAVHIGDANGLDVHGEAVAYVGGELARAMQPVAARLMCPQCECK